MEKISQQIFFEADFMDILIQTQKESERLGVNRISDILILKALIFKSESFISEFLLRCKHLQWKKTKASIEKEVSTWMKQAEKKPTPLFADCEGEGEKKEEEDGEISEDGITHVYFAFEDGVINIMQEASRISGDSNVIDEVAFVLAMLDHRSEYVDSFFNTIEVDNLVLIRYFEGLMAEGTYDEMFEMLEEEPENEKVQEEDNKKKTFIRIPEKLKSYVKVLKVDASVTSPIMGREKETERLTQDFSKLRKVMQFWLENLELEKQL